MPDERPDVVLVDMEMPEMDGIATTRKLRDRHPRMGILILTAYMGIRSVMRASASGAQGIVYKDDPASKICRWIREAAAGLPAGREPDVFAGTYFVRGVLRSPIPVRAGDLTDRERQVLGLYGKGYTTAMTASELGLSETTVKTHTQHVMTKLGAKNRVEAIAIAMGEGII